MRFLLVGLLAVVLSDCVTAQELAQRRAQFNDDVAIAHSLFSENHEKKCVSAYKKITKYPCRSVLQALLFGRGT